MNSKTYYLAELEYNTNTSDGAVFASKYNWNNNRKISFSSYRCVLCVLLSNTYCSSYILKPIYWNLLVTTQKYMQRLHWPPRDWYGCGRPGVGGLKPPTFTPLVVRKDKDCMQVSRWADI